MHKKVQSNQNELMDTMMTVKNLIRPARAEEASLLSALALQSKGNWDYDTKFLESCKTELTYSPSQIDSANYCFQIGQTNTNQICGFFALDFIESAHPELEALFIKPIFIGQGWGKRLLHAAIQRAKQANAKSIKLHSDPFAESFYLANGAIKIGEVESHSIPGRFLPLLEICL